MNTSWQQKNPVLAAEQLRMQAESVLCCVVQAQAVQHLPPLERQEGIDLHGCDTFGKPHTFR